MEKQEIFSKFKDYKSELEKVLETKSFSEEVKNLLLSMIYKIEASYKDYAKIKIDVKSKKDFLEEIIEDIKNNCDEIELLNSTEEEKNTIVLKEQKKIVTYANEREMLKAIIQISNKECNVAEEYFYLKEPIQNLFDFGETMEAEEVIRDFDGWSWNIERNEIENFEYNLLYQDLRILIGNQKLNEIALQEDCILALRKCIEEKREER